MPRKAAVLATAIATGLISVLAAGGSTAAEHSAVVSADPVDWTPQVLDGRVRGIATVGTTTVVVGDFTQVQQVAGDPADPGASGQTLDRSDIFAFDEQGKVSTSFVPEIEGSEVFDVIPSGDGQSVYIAGSFRSVDGLPSTARVARVDVTTGKVLESFKAPSFNNKATALDLVDGVLYVAGWFTRVGGQPRTLLTALDSETGADRNTLDLTFRKTWNGGVIGAAEMTVAADGSSLVVMGNFRRVEGQYRPQVAMVNLERATATLARWSTTRYASQCNRAQETYMWGLDASPDGRYFVIGTTGSYSGGPMTGTLCDTVARWEFRPRRPDQQPTWIDYTGGDTVTDIEVTGAAIYAGGHFRWFNNPYGINVEGPGAVRRMGLAALDPRNGLPLAWNPGRQRGWGVWGFASTDQGLWVGHDTDLVANELHQRLALFTVDTVTGQRAPDNTGTLPGEVFLLGQQHDSGFDDAVTERAFTETSAGPLTPVDAGGVPWSQALAAFMVDGDLYAAFADGTLVRRGYNGVKFGAPRTVEHNQLTAFSQELAQMRSMWFDRDTGRLYFTLAGSGNRLFYRYFTPESRVVGALRYQVDVGTFRADRVTAGFLAEGRLWYRTARNQVRSVTWNNGPVAGTMTKVSGPGVDDAVWGSRTLFLYAE